MTIIFTLVALAVAYLIIVAGAKALLKSSENAKAEREAAVFMQLRRVGR